MDIGLKVVHNKYALGIIISNECRFQAQRPSRVLSKHGLTSSSAYFFDR